jgi:hypothetical protein
MGELTTLNHIDFVVQWLILGVALYGFYAVRISQKKHSRAFLWATSFNIGAIVFLMGPRLLAHIPEINLFHLDIHASLILAHSSVGLLATAVAVLLLMKWKAVDFRLGMCRRQDLMALSFITWMIASGVGVFGYLRHLFGWFM